MCDDPYHFIICIKTQQDVPHQNLQLVVLDYLTQYYQRFALSLTVVSGFKPHIDQASRTEF